MLTRFVPSIAPAREPVGGDPARIVDVRAIVRLRGSAGIRELIVATDGDGCIHVVSDREQLPQRARAQLAFHEVASGRTIEIDAEELHIFDLQTMEMLPDAPGPNDALYVYGLLHGPYPSYADTPVVAVEGQLTLTRSDLLGGLVDGVTQALAYAPEPAGSRCVSALLPGERAELIETGRGVILALPLVPTWLPECPVPNDLVVAQLLYDVLSALRSDLGIDSPVLPVPNRATLEAELVAAGWKIEGDEAVRAKGKGLMGALRGSEKRKLPRQGSLDELVGEAKSALAKMQNVPTAEAAALRRRATRMYTQVHVTPQIPKPPPPHTAATPAPVAAPRPRVETPSTDWMKDFVDAHRSPTRPAPRVSTPARVVSRDATPAWMQDFAETAPSDEPDEAAPAPKPDWKSDFE
ncbi:MAG TPA: hypothetical protein VLB44_23295 [Kofleriaceae bacterium]|nr:hypothetical protein [Kofleriaceae bacterium]